MISDVLDWQAIGGFQHEKPFYQVTGHLGKAVGKAVLQSKDFLKREVFVCRFEWWSAGNELKENAPKRP